MQAKIEAKLQQLSVGCVTTLWDLLVWRLSADRWVVGHNSIRLSDEGLTLEAAVAKFDRLLD